jgi:hypothetical protein
MPRLSGDNHMETRCFAFVNKHTSNNDKRHDQRDFDTSSKIDYVEVTVSYTTKISHNDYHFEQDAKTLNTILRHQFITAPHDQQS